MSNIINRQNELNSILEFEAQHIIKVLTGVRRSGKSTLLKMINDYFVNKYSDESVVFINLDSFKFAEIDNKNQFATLLKTEITKNTKVLLLDEVQLVTGWERIVNGLFAEDKYDIYITGSNSKLLSGELGSLLSGRYVTYHIQPLSFAEIKSNNSDFQFEDYIKTGGFPIISQMSFNKNDRYEQSFKIIDDIYNSVILKDVVERHNIRNVELLHRLIMFIFQNLGNIFSANRIRDYLKSQNRNVSVETVYDYLEFLQEAFVISRVPRFNIKGKEIFKTNEKFYLADHAFIGAKFENTDAYISGILENIVYCELIRRNYDVTVGIMQDYEIDFVALKRGTNKYIQVSYLMEDPKTFERELRPLQKLNTKEECLILTMDHSRSGNYDGIKVMHIEDWLLND
ncbi:MAG: ATP-binding protein [Bifidobacteriaceae bacterium]|jgi:predicted AAA+ superfamily ATPase|nr:ATP-binding protein [Bifidobacteriaceae bacterium]